MSLFGDLVATVADRELSGMRTQVCQSMVPLLLHLKDQCPAVVMVSANLQALWSWQRDRAARSGHPQGSPDHQPLPHTAVFSQPDL